MSELAITLHAAGAEVSGGTGVDVDLESDAVPLRRALRAELNVSAVTGALALSLQTSRDAASWVTASDGTYEAPGASEIWIGECFRYVRVAWNVGTSATFELTGVAYQTFCSLDQLSSLGGAADILTDAVDTATRLKHLQSASAVALSYLAKAGPTPVLGGGAALAQAVAQLAVVDIITSDTGPHPSEEATELLLAAGRRATQWLRDVSARRVDPGVIFSDPPTEPTTSAGVVYGEARRTWV
jgi:hypothetical protein